MIYIVQIAPKRIFEPFYWTLTLVRDAKFYFDFPARNRLSLLIFEISFLRHIRKMSLSMNFYRFFYNTATASKLVMQYIQQYG